MPWSALPEHLNSPEKWKGTDWDNPFQRWMLKFKGWFAFGPRAKERWARWRKYPILIFRLRGKGPARYETSNGDMVCSVYSDSYIFWETSDYTYLSPIQYWSRWHIQLQWPLFFAFHFYFKAKDVLDPSINNGKKVDGKLIYFRIGARRDSDEVYWFPSLFIGGAFN